MEEILLLWNKKQRVHVCDHRFKQLGPKYFPQWHWIRASTRAHKICNRICYVLLYLQGYQAMSPHDNNDLMASSLPPMSTFRGPGQPGYQSSSPTVNGSQGEMPPSQQPPPPPPQPNNNSSAPPPTGNGPAGSGSQSDALGNALKSVSTVSTFFCGQYSGLLDVRHSIKENDITRDFVIEVLSGFPLRLENLEKWEGIFQSGKSQGILNRLEKSGKFTQNTGKLKEFEINIIWYF